MQPKTAIQKRVVKLSTQLPDLTKRQLIWGHNLFDRFMYKRKHDCTCFECGHRFPESKKMICPKCKSKLQLWDKTIRSGNDYWYMSIFTTVKEFQVLRYFRINKYMKVDTPADYFFYEVYQHWISNKGNHVIVSKLISPFSYYRFDPWSKDSEMEVRINTNQNHLIKDIPMYPYRKILPEIYRNGFVDEYYGYHPAQLFQMILYNPIAETFIKTNNIEMLKVFSRDQKRFTKFFHAYKICMRHNYKIKDYSTWLDYMELLNYFKYDTHNPKYICSTNLIKDHQRLYVKKKKIDDRKYQEKLRLDKIKTEKETAERIEREKRELEESLKIKQKFVNMKFTCKELSIVVLTDINDFMVEGETLNHCVYRNEYYKKKDSLILSARKGEERLETIELDLRDMHIIQSRGLDNQPSPYHKEILSLVKRNIKKLELVA